MKGKLVLPIILMLLFAVTRWPGLLPPNFSAAYALMFCAGVYFPKRLAWWLPLATMFTTDLLLNLYYHSRWGTPVFGPEMIGNYLAYACLIGLGRWFGPRASFLSLLGGGLIGAVLFYLVTNTFSWMFNPFHNPEYTRNFAGWLRALTIGTAGWPETFAFFRNSLGSAGLFTALFAGAMKLMEAREPEEKEAAGETPELEPEAQPEEAGA